MSSSRPMGTNLIFFLYWLARVVTSPLVLLYFLYRGYRDPRYFRHFPERLGARPASFHRTAPGCIWLHAVSVGEVIAAERLIDELRQRAPEIPIYVSTATRAGRAVAESKLSGCVDGISFAPIDYSFAIRRIIRGIRPAVLVVLETEIWPELFDCVKRADCGLLIVNGRISDRALPRYRRFAWFFRVPLALPDAIHVQTPRDRDRYVQAGAPPARVHVSGNLKYDAAPVRTDPPPFISRFLQTVRPRFVWIAASTMPPFDREDVDEDDVVLAAFRELAPNYPGLLLIVAPRKPESFTALEDKLRRAAVPYTCRSSERTPDAGLPHVLVLDSMGELSSLFPFADVVFLGGTLARRGGHNVLEPASAGRAVVAGPHMENFAAIAEEFDASHAWRRISSSAQLAEAVGALLVDRSERQALGERAAAAAARYSGVASALAGAILDTHDRDIPIWRGERPARAFAAQIWTMFARWKGSADAASALALDRPVISIGNLSMGGSGKTPVVAKLAGELRQRGRSPAILTRGYRRRSIETSIVLVRGAEVPTAMTGDEAQILLREGNAHLGIGADRSVTGGIVQRELPVDIFLLDDGFQHRRLRRDLDIVLIDSLDPFPGAGVFPLGRLREPETALSRASAFVITRALDTRQYRGIVGRLRAYNPHAPIFRSCVRARYWTNARTGQRLEELPGDRFGAFCGLGNPGSFWQTLRRQNVDPCFRWPLGDHHSYSHEDLRRLRLMAQEREAAGLLTTEKDMMNLPPNGLDFLKPLDLYWLKIEAHIEGSENLLSLIEKQTADPNHRPSHPVFHLLSNRKSR